MTDIYTRDWTDAMKAGIADGHYYKMVRADDGLLTLLAWADDGSGPPVDDDAYEVSESGFSCAGDLFDFAFEISDLLELDAVTIVKSIRS